jgi:phenylacetate-CoA ligase
VPDRTGKSATAGARAVRENVVRTVEPIEHATTAELRALQFDRMRAVVRHAYEGVPHYRARFDAVGVNPDDLRHLEDISRFPLTAKEDLRQNYPFGMFAVPMDQIVRIHASSGTTGKPTVVGYTRNDIDTWSKLMARSIAAAGGLTSDKIHVAYGYGLFTGGLGAHYGGEHLGAAVIPVSGGFTERQVQIINDFQPDIVMVTPSYMLAIADEFDRQGIDARTCSLRLGIFGAEPWGEGMRRELERRLGLQALDIYGLSEVMGPGVAQECADSKGALTLWEDHFYPEIIDPATGAPVPDGQAGELVLTTLTKDGMPLIRYRTRDLTRLLPPTTRAMRRIDRISGRSDDMLIIRGVNVFPSNIEAVLANEDRLAPHYLLELRRPGSLDELDVVVETRSSLAAKLSSADIAELERHSEHLIKSFVGITTKVRVVEPGTLERSQGKAKRVLDLRPKD